MGINSNSLAKLKRSAQANAGRLKRKKEEEIGDIDVGKCIDKWVESDLRKQYLELLKVKVMIDN